MTGANLLQEEYADLSTLEHRLQEVARKMVNRPGQTSGSAQSPFGLGLGAAPNGLSDQQSGMHGSAAGPPLQQQARQSPLLQQQQQQQQPQPQLQLQHQHTMSQPMQPGQAYQGQSQNGYGAPHSALSQRPQSSSQQAHSNWSSGGAQPVGRGAPDGSGGLMQAETLQQVGGLPGMQSQGGYNVGGPASSQADLRLPNGMRQHQHLQQHQHQHQHQGTGMVPIKRELVNMNGMVPLKQEAAPINGMLLHQQGRLQHPHHQHAQQPLPQQAHMGHGQHSMQVTPAGPSSYISMLCYTALITSA